MGRFAAFAATFALVAVGLGATTGARAEIQFCNKFPQKVYVAIAYPQSDQSWISRGWLEIDTGDCAEFDSALHPSTIYYRGESVPYRNASGASVTRVWSNSGAPVRDLGEGQLQLLECAAAGAELDPGRFLAARRRARRRRFRHASPSSRTGFTPRPR